MKITRRRVLLGLVVVFALMQVVRPDTDAPAENPDQTLAARMTVPPEVSRVLQSACLDCHSHRTEWPWYSQVAPVSWFVGHHVEEAREHLNFSTWGELSEYRAQKLLGEIAEEVEEGKMPLRSYVWMHGDAKLEPLEIELVHDWATQEQQLILQRLGEAPPRDP